MSAFEWQPGPQFPVTPRRAEIVVAERHAITFSKPENGSRRVSCPCGWTRNVRGWRLSLIAARKHIRASRLALKVVSECEVEEPGP